MVRLIWVAHTPTKPPWLPGSSVWVSGPHTPLEFERVGEWVGCVARTHERFECWFTDDRGSVTFHSLFAPLHGEQIQKVRILPGELPDFRLFLKKRDVVVRIVRLQDGPILAPVQDLQDVTAVLDENPVTKTR
jgi:hypothetical protein